MAQLILFSGPCNSGKTTTLNAVYNELFNHGCRAMILDELIRQKTDKPIDELRKNAHEYLMLQEQIITEKMEQEKAAIADRRISEVWLADRAITDSLYYLENYVNKTELNSEDTILFAKLHKRICEYLDEYFRYYCLIQFKPLKAIQQDMFRPNNINHLQQYEYECINRLNTYYFIKMHVVDLNLYTQEAVVEQILNFAGL